MSAWGDEVHQPYGHPDDYPAPDLRTWRVHVRRPLLHSGYHSDNNRAFAQAASTSTSQNPFAPHFSPHSYYAATGQIPPPPTVTRCEYDSHGPSGSTPYRSSPPPPATDLSYPPSCSRFPSTLARSSPPLSSFYARGPHGQPDEQSQPPPPYAPPHRNSRPYRASPPPTARPYGTKAPVRIVIGRVLTYV